MNRFSLALFLLAAAAVVYGVWLISRPAGFIVAGLLAAAVGVLVLETGDKAAR